MAVDDGEGDADDKGGEDRLGHEVHVAAEKDESAETKESAEDAGEAGDGPAGEIEGRAGQGSEAGIASGEGGGEVRHADAEHVLVHVGAVADLAGEGLRHDGVFEGGEEGEGKGDADEAADVGEDAARSDLGEAWREVGQEDLKVASSHPHAGGGGVDPGQDYKDEGEDGQLRKPPGEHEPEQERACGEGEGLPVRQVDPAEGGLEMVKKVFGASEGASGLAIPRRGASWFAMMRTAAPVM